MAWRGAAPANRASIAAAGPPRPGLQDSTETWPPHRPTTAIPHPRSARHAAAHSWEQLTCATSTACYPAGNTHPRSTATGACLRSGGDEPAAHRRLPRRIRSVTAWMEAHCAIRATAAERGPSMPRAAERRARPAISVERPGSPVGRAGIRPAPGGSPAASKRGSARPPRSGPIDWLPARIMQRNNAMTATRRSLARSAPPPLLAALAGKRR